MVLQYLFEEVLRERERETYDVCFCLIVAIKKMGYLERKECTYLNVGK